MNKYIKFVIAGLIIALAAYLFTIREYGYGVTLILISTIPIFLFFKNEYILLAFWQMRKQNLDKAKSWLQKIKNPKSQLIQKQMGYYNFMLGITEAQNNANVAEKYMKKALDFGLNFKHDRAMANLSLAGSTMAKGRKKEAQVYLKAAKELDTNQMFSDQIKMMQEQMKRINIGKNMHNPNMRRRGKHF